ncbi:MAG: ATP-binding cassette domain-containing protein [Micromonosporaceae bacterium]|nr:ATP-binding cassette domain-containing protein [Micromonosporaceae bacterium]
MNQRLSVSSDPGGPGPDAFAIHAVDLRRRFGERWAVDGVNLAVPSSQIYGFLGPNGAGKSTTVRMLCGLLIPTGGRATVLGHDVARDPGGVHLAIGAALQATAIDDRQTGLEHLRLQGRLYGLRRAETERRIAELQDLIELGEAIQRPAATYSGGMKRRLDLALALIHNPDVLFLDEPTTGLDPVSRFKLWDEVRRINRERGTTVFLTTQYLEEADELAERVGIIADGRLVAEGTPDELKRRIGADVVIARVSGDPERARQVLDGIPEVERVDVDATEVTATVGDGPTAITPVAVALAAAEISVETLTLRQPTLDDVFLAVTGHRLATGTAAQPDAGASELATTGRTSQ